MVRKLIPDVVQQQDLLQLPGTATVRDAARMMAQRDVRSVLVVEGGKLQGIFTGTDLTSRVVAVGLDPDTTILSRVMTKNPETIAPGETAVAALRRMHAGRHRHLPIAVDGIAVGILSRRDFSGYEIEEIERQERIWEEI